MISSVQKVPYVCFDCRIARKKDLSFFNRECPNFLSEPKRTPLKGFPQQGDKCPGCLKAMVFLGRYFKVPPRGNLKEWRKAQLLWENGWRADGYSAAPQTMRDVKSYLSSRTERAQKMRAALSAAKQEKRWRQARRRRVS